MNIIKQYKRKILCKMSDSMFQLILRSWNKMSFYGVSNWWNFTERIEGKEQRIANRNKLVEGHVIHER